MKKQYRYQTTFGKYHLYIYHNGECVETKTLWENINDEVDRLKSAGYTYGFTKLEVEKEKQRYEHMLENVIDNEYDVEIMKEVD